jgi:muconate cycloisomerase
VATVTQIDVVGVDLPLRMPFNHAAARRSRSESVFVHVQLDNGVDGWGEALPRPYVTGETVGGATDVLQERIGPALVGQRFAALADVAEFLAECDGAAPTAWVGTEVPQLAAWCAVDLALLDAFARSERRSVLDALVTGATPSPVRYSGVVSADRRRRVLSRLVQMRMYGIRQVKVKVGLEDGVDAVRVARRVLGPGADLRVDANMAWPPDDAPALVEELQSLGVEWFEQPVAADDLLTAAALIDRSRARVMADESCTTPASLRALISRRACSGVNVRISKCGGLVAAYRRCCEARAAGLELQVGCHVGESSLLSSAHLCLLDALAARHVPVRYAEGCFGRRLLADDAASPSLQFGYGGRRPTRPTGPGLGVAIDPAVVARFTRTADLVH